MSDSRNTPGTFSWNELLTTDAKTSTTFYGSLLGWTFDEMPTSESTYFIAKKDGVPVGGLMTFPTEFPKEVPPRWGCYITVEDTDAAVEKAVSLGATMLMPPTDFPDIGRFAALRDPQGAVFSVGVYF